MYGVMWYVFPCILVSRYKIKMTINQIIRKLDINQEVFKNLLIQKTREEYLWRPQPEKWCLLEIVCHLFDEEREDFKTRVKLTLENPLKELLGFNPVEWILRVIIYLKIMSKR